MQPAFDKTMASTLLKTTRKERDQQSSTIVNSLNLGSERELLHKFDHEIGEARDDTIDSEFETSKQIRTERHRVLVDGRDINCQGELHTGDEMINSDLKTLDMHF